MPKKTVEEILEENSELFKDLADALLCPSCSKIVRGPKYNLGEVYNWAEGCKDCHVCIEGEDNK